MNYNEHLYSIGGAREDGETSPLSVRRDVSLVYSIPLFHLFYGVRTGDLEQKASGFSHSAIEVKRTSKNFLENDLHFDSNHMRL